MDTDTDPQQPIAVATSTVSCDGGGDPSTSATAAWYNLLGAELEQPSDDNPRSIDMLLADGTRASFRAPSPGGAAQWRAALSRALAMAAASAAKRVAEVEAENAVLKERLAVLLDGPLAAHGEQTEDKQRIAELERKERHPCRSLSDSAIACKSMCRNLPPGGLARCGTPIHMGSMGMNHYRFLNQFTLDDRDRTSIRNTVNGYTDSIKIFGIRDNAEISVIGQQMATHWRHRYIRRKVLVRYTRGISCSCK